MNLTTRQLEVFVSVARRCSFAQAAASLGISQSAVSNHIASIEDELGCRLFIRRRGASPTLSLEGEQLFKDTSLFLEALQRTAGRAASEHAISLRIFAGSHVLECFVKPGLARFHSSNPGIILDFVTKVASNDVPAAIRSHRIDCALFTSPILQPGFECELIGDLQSGLYGPADSAMAKAAVDSQRFVLPLEGSSESMVLAKQMLKLGYRAPNVLFRTQYPAVAVEMAAREPCLAPLLDTMAQQFDVDRRLRKISALPPWHLCLAFSNRIGLAARQTIRKFFRDISEKALQTQIEVEELLQQEQLQPKGA